MLLHVELLKDGEVKVAQGQSHGGQDVTEGGAYLGVFRCVIDRDDVEHHAEADDEHHVEEQEHTEVTHDVDDHGNDVTETRDDSHEEELLQQASDNDNDHNQFSSQSIWVKEHLRE